MAVAILTREEMTSTFVVYTHSVEAKIIWVGMCELIRLWNCPDAWENLLWQKITANNADITVDIKWIGINAIEGMNARHKIIAENGNPPCNADNRIANTRKMWILCNETGETFPSQAATVIAHGCHPAQLNAHVNGKAGYKTVKGKTYKKIPDPNLETPPT